MPANVLDVSRYSLIPMARKPEDFGANSGFRTFWAGLGSFFLQESFNNCHRLRKSGCCRFTTWDISGFPLLSAEADHRIEWILNHIDRRFGGQ